MLSTCTGLKEEERSEAKSKSSVMMYKIGQDLKKLHLVSEQSTMSCDLRTLIMPASCRWKTLDVDQSKTFINLPHLSVPSNPLIVLANVCAHSLPRHSFLCLFAVALLPSPFVWHDDGLPGVLHPENVQTRETQRAGWFERSPEGFALLPAPLGSALCRIDVVDPPDVVGGGEETVPGMFRISDRLGGHCALVALPCLALKSTPMRREEVVSSGQDGGDCAIYEAGTHQKLENDAFEEIHRCDMMVMRGWWLVFGGFDMAGR